MCSVSVFYSTKSFENVETFCISPASPPLRAQRFLPLEYNGIQKVAIKHIANKDVKSET
jgi:hypothetical protein